MTKRKRKKRKKSLSSTQRQLAARVFIGLGMRPHPIVDDGVVAAYALNPGIRGPRELTAHEISTWPAFGRLRIAYDDHMRRILSVKESELVPFWMRRFIASTEEELMYGYMFTPGLDRHRFEVKILSFDYKLASELFGGPPDRLKISPIPKDLVLETIKACVGLLADGTGSQFKLICSYAVDPGPGGWVVRGGEA